MTLNTRNAFICFGETETKISTLCKIIQLIKKAENMKLIYDCSKMPIRKVLHSLRKYDYFPHGYIHFITLITFMNSRSEV